MVGVGDVKVVTILGHNLILKYLSYSIFKDEPYVN